MDNPPNYMKYVPLYGQPCELYEMHAIIWTTPVNYMKYITLHGHL